MVEATNLKQINTLKKNNSFIRVYLGNQKRKTRAIENSNDPEWNAVFTLYAICF